MGILAALLTWAACAGLAAGQGALPPFPGPVRVSELARDTAGSVLGEVVATRPTRGGWSCPTKLRTYTREGNEMREDTLEFAWDEAHPPVRLGMADARLDSEYPLVLHDAERRLLLVSYEREATEGALLVSARIPSRRFSAEELDWAWLAFRNGGLALPTKPDPGFDLDWFAARPGHRELALRFGNSATWLDAQLAAPALGAEELELLQLALQMPGLESRALHVLLAHGAAVDPAGIRDPTSRLCARLATGEAQAQVELHELLDRGAAYLAWDKNARHERADRDAYDRLGREVGSRLPALVEAATHGSREALPHLREYVRTDTANSVFAWLALGGSAEELLALRGGEPPWSATGELHRQGSMEALRVALAGFTRCVQLRPSERYLWHFLVDTLAARLRSTAPEEVLASVQPVVRAALPPLEREQLLRTLMHAGDPTALEEIEASSDGILVRMPVETVEGERGVRLLVRKLLSAKTGFPNDDTGSVTGCVAAVTRALHERSARERGLALRLLEDRERIDPTIQWALGELPAPEIVPRLGRSMVIEACALDLAPEANRYVEVLQRMRADPRSFAFPLALLRDEESLPAFLDWLEEGCRTERSDFPPLFAIDRIGSSAAADRLFAIGCTSDWAARQCLLELAKLDRPSNLPRLAALCARHPGREGFFYWRAFLVLLGRRD